MIQKADPRARVVVIAVVLVMVLIGVVIIASADAYRAALVDWIARDPARSRSRAVTVAVALAAAVLLPVFGAAAYLWYFGVRTARDRRFPPHGARLFVDMEVQQGEEARMRGRMLQTLAIGLAAIGMVFAVMFWRLIVLTSAPR